MTASSILSLPRIRIIRESMAPATMPEIPPEISATPLPPQRRPIRIEMIVIDHPGQLFYSKDILRVDTMSRSDMDRKELRLSALGRARRAGCRSMVCSSSS